MPSLAATSSAWLCTTETTQNKHKAGKREDKQGHVPFAALGKINNHTLSPFPIHVHGEADEVPAAPRRTVPGRCDLALIKH